MKSTLLLIVPFLSGCLSLVPTTAFKASQLNPLITDPADLAAFLDLPDGLGTLPDGNILVLEATRDDDGTVMSQTYTLQDWQGGLRIAPEDRDRFRAQQAMILEWKDGPGAKGSLSIDLAPCAIGDGPADDARYSVDLMLEQDGPRLPLLRNAALADLGLGDLPACRED